MNTIEIDPKDYASFREKIWTHIRYEDAVEAGDKNFGLYRDTEKLTPDQEKEKEDRTAEIRRKIWSEWPRLEFSTQGNLHAGMVTVLNFIFYIPSGSTIYGQPDIQIKGSGSENLLSQLNENKILSHNNTYAYTCQITIPVTQANQNFYWMDVKIAIRDKTGRHHTFIGNCTLTVNGGNDRTNITNNVTISASGNGFINLNNSNIDTAVPDNSGNPAVGSIEIQTTRWAISLVQKTPIKWFPNINSPASYEQLVLYSYNNIPYHLIAGEHVIIGRGASSHVNVSTSRADADRENLWVIVNNSISRKHLTWTVNTDKVTFKDGSIEKKSEVGTLISYSDTNKWIYGGSDISIPGKIIANLGKIKLSLGGAICAIINPVKRDVKNMTRDAAAKYINLLKGGNAGTWWLFALRSGIECFRIQRELEPEPYSRDAFSPDIIHKFHTAFNNAKKSEEGLLKLNVTHLYILRYATLGNSDEDDIHSSAADPNHARIIACGGYFWLENLKDAPLQIKLPQDLDPSERLIQLNKDEIIPLFPGMKIQILNMDEIVVTSWTDYLLDKKVIKPTNHKKPNQE